MSAEDPENPDTTDGEESGGSTKSTKTRWAYTNDVIALALVAFAIGASAAHIYRGTPVPPWLYAVDAAAILTAVVWAFGAGAFKAAKEGFGGG